jgi:hypothetical protein
LCIWLAFYSLLSSLILSNLKHELLNRLRSTMAANVLRDRIEPKKSKRKSFSLGIIQPECQAD